MRAGVYRYGTEEHTSKAALVRIRTLVRTGALLERSALNRIITGMWNKSLCSHMSIMCCKGGVPDGQIVLHYVRLDLTGWTFIPACKSEMQLRILNDKFDVAF